MLQATGVSDRLGRLERLAKEKADCRSLVEELMPRSSSSRRTSGFLITEKTSTMNILVTNDQPMLVRAIEGPLRKEGYTIPGPRRTAGQVLEQIAHQAPDLVLPIS